MTRQPDASTLQDLADCLDLVQPGGEHEGQSDTFKRALLEGAISALLDRCNVPTPLYDAECERRMAAQLERRMDKAS